MKRYELPILTALRGIAAWWVVCYHFRDATGLSQNSFLLAIFTHGYLAVDFFFVLSGFVIFLSYGEALAQFSLRAWRHFMARRIARIYPLHLVILGFYVLNPLAIHYFSRAGVVGGRYDPHYLLASIFLVQNWGFFDDLAWSVPAWSISTEFAAYLLFPAILFFVRRTCVGPVSHFAWAVAIATLLACAFYMSGCLSIGDKIPQLGLLRCVLEFAMGAIAAHLYINREQRLESVWPWLAALLALILGTGVMMGRPDFFYIPIVFFIGVILFAMQPAQKIPILSSKAMVYLGEISYSTYLVHYFIKDWVKFLSPSVGIASFLLYVGLVFFASVLLFRIVERPGQAWGKRFLDRNRLDLTNR